jgi:hypothetical protein
MRLNEFRCAPHWVTAQPRGVVATMQFSAGLGAKIFKVLTVDVDLMLNAASTARLDEIRPPAQSQLNRLPPQARR